MNWDALGAIAEMVGGIAVIISLIYLAVQMRLGTQELARNAEASRLAAFERNIESGNRIRELLMLNPDLAAIYAKGARKLDLLDEGELFRFGMLVRNIFSAMQGAYVKATRD